MNTEPAVAVKMPGDQLDATLGAGATPTTRPPAGRTVLPSAQTAQAAFCINIDITVVAASNTGRLRIRAEPIRFLVSTV